MSADAAILSDAHARTVLATMVLLGAASGAIGTPLVLRRHALLGDAVGHATLPGLAGASIASIALGGSGREPAVLLGGAALGAAAGAATVWIVRRWARTSADAATAVSLGTLFGLGVVLLSALQQLDAGHRAGLDAYLLGSAAGLVRADLWIALAIAIATTVTFAVLARDIRAATFDPTFAQVVGRPVRLIGGAWALLAVVTVVAGMQAVGLVLVLALLVIPPVAARCWTDRFMGVVAIASAIGAGASAVGAAASALAPRLPTGAMVVLALGAAFAASAVRAALRRSIGARA
ncbi:MAG: metal ABC transporter permease [Phycisphaerales bacterium]